MTIGKEKITAGEFVYLYNKNNSNSGIKDSPEAYLSLFQLFKMKSLEARACGYDTLPGFIEEFNTYKEQLTKSFSAREKILKKIEQEAPKRNQKEYKVDFIMTQIKGKSPEDTIEAYRKIMSARKELQNSDFETVALKYSEDKYIKKNKGHLPYLPLYRIPYPVQNFIIHNDRQGNISDPIRVQNSYFIVKVNASRPFPGVFEVAHIIRLVTPQMTNNEKDKAKKDIFDIYQKIKQGADFNSFLPLSDDQLSAKQNGKLPPFITGEMVEEFQEAAFALHNPGEISPPVRTLFGWHIIQLISKGNHPQKLKQREETIKESIRQDVDIQKLTQRLAADSLKKLLDFRAIKQPAFLHRKADTSLITGNWKTPKKRSLHRSKIFSIGNKKFYEYDLSRYIEDRRQKFQNLTVKRAVNESLQNYIFHSLEQEERENMAETDPEYRHLLQEYYDGILLFEVMQREVWKRAKQDTANFQRYLLEHFSGDIQNFDNQVFIVEYKDKKDLLSCEKAMHLPPEVKSKALLQIVDKNRNLTKKIPQNVIQKQNYYANILSSCSDLHTKEKILLPKKHLCIYLLDRKIITEAVKIKGKAMADYQAYLEKNLTAKLKNKYPVKIDAKIWSEIQKLLKK